MTRIDHIGIAVQDLEQAARVYEVLGLSVSHTETVEEQGVKIGFLRIGDSELELLEPTSESSPVGRFLAARGEGIHHLCIEVEDIVETMRQLREAGARLVSEEPQRGAGGALVAFVHPRSAHGVLLELTQPALER
ncbi:MAG: methylmalonyl-CoA epimerase [Anaerolineae bacterium]|nr:methylmalonyl-CoA epimerase [Anaerolineae bacterium]